MDLVRLLCLETENSNSFLLLDVCEEKMHLKNHGHSRNFVDFVAALANFLKLPRQFLFLFCCETYCSKFVQQFTTIHPFFTSFSSLCDSSRFSICQKNPKENNKYTCDRFFESFGLSFREKRIFRLSTNFI